MLPSHKSTSMANSHPNNNSSPNNLTDILSNTHNNNTIPMPPCSRRPLSNPQET